MIVLLGMQGVLMAPDLGMHDISCDTIATDMHNARQPQHTRGDGEAFHWQQLFAEGQIGEDQSRFVITIHQDMALLKAGRRHPHLGMTKP